MLIHKYSRCNSHIGSSLSIKFMSKSYTNASYLPYGGDLKELIKEFRTSRYTGIRKPKDQDKKVNVPNPKTDVPT